ncbi:hypothetical protein [Secundilactobacillus kimchicus]|uniref:hypothetical protein n=1 Tax=Secundilactobacillus kimchicus TaxID=528209 RepID=UPI0024A8840E|nr:hypothetical protein [Secundilactobacillus kimchicus]
MKIKDERTFEQVVYKNGQVIVDGDNETYQIIYNPDTGYALLELEAGIVRSNWYETIRELLDIYFENLKNVNLVNAELVIKDGDTQD